MALVEYLYVDEKRLDTYFEQISSPVTYDKVPMWNAEIGLTGPKAGGAQQRFARPHTMHEKISKLTEYLEDEGLVEYGRASEESMLKRFRIETCRAQRVFIPPDHGQPPEVGALNVWISAVHRTREEIEAILERGWSEAHLVPGQKRGPGNLYLLEDYRHSDPQRVFHYDASPYSALSLMVRGGLGPRESPERYFSNLIRPEFDKRFDPAMVDLNTPDKLDPSVRTHLEKIDLPDDRKESFYQFLSFSSHFLIDPASALAQIGAQIGPVRTIRTLYRVRAYFAEAELGWNYGVWDLATFGYPIFIAEDADPL